MRFFAIETNIRKLKGQFLNDTEQEILTVYKHPFAFFTSAGATIALYVLSLGVRVGAFRIGIPFDAILWIMIVGTAVAGISFMNAYANWRYDFLLFTTDKMVMVDTSLFRQKVDPINLEQLSSVSGVTNFGNMFSFGTLRFQMNEKEIDVPYIPQVSAAAARISDIFTDFQRRKMRVGAPILKQSENMEEAMKIYEAQQNVKVQQSTGDENPGSGMAPPGQQPAQQPKAMAEGAAKPSAPEPPPAAEQIEQVQPETIGPAPEEA